MKQPLAKSAAIRHLVIVGVAMLLASCGGSRGIVPGPVGAAAAAAASAEGSVAVAEPTPIDAAIGLQRKGVYVIGPEDVLSVSVLREPDLSLPTVRVGNEGHFEMLLIGQVVASGKTPAELSAEIRQRYESDYLVDPQIAVNVAQVNSRRLTVDGAVAKPGVYPVGTGMDLISAVAVAGGTTELAKLKEVAVFRQVDGQNMVAAFDLTRIRSGENVNPELLPGDIVVVGFDELQKGLQTFLQAAPIFSIFRVF